MKPLSTKEKDLIKKIEKQKPRHAFEKKTDRNYKDGDRN